ncbi:MAG: hypothetical protein VX700_02095 [Pseudomonadota bacterium]|nr:hypothetical protein [Pseudomonadota bacterium]
MFNTTSQLLMRAAVISVVATGAAKAQVSPDMKGEMAPSKSYAAPEKCKANAVIFEDNPNLTREEKIALMDKALFVSLNKYDECQSEISSQSASAGDGGGGASGGGSGASTASSGMQGTQPSLPSRPVPAVVAHETGEAKNKNNSDPANGTAALNNGKIPEDIPPADNDSVLEAQIREAAQNEPDPEIRKKLWNEYRKYKGLSPVK